MYIHVCKKRKEACILITEPLLFIKRVYKHTLEYVNSLKYHVLYKLEAL